MLVICLSSAWVIYKCNANFFYSEISYKIVIVSLKELRSDICFFHYTWFILDWL